MRNNLTKKQKEKIIKACQDYANEMANMRSYIKLCDVIVDVIDN